MSISDLIVVMKDGVIHQIGKPQEVYEQPVNLFVAKFLGTPPINVFAGEVRSETLYIGEEAVLAVPGAADGAVTVAVRPEGFEVQKDGALGCALKTVEVMGRDISVVCTHPLCENTAIRAIVDADNLAQIGGSTVRFALKPAKVHLFDPATGDRIRFDAQ